MKKLLIGALLAMTWFSSAALAQTNLVQNPGFESGFASWNNNNWGVGPPAHTGANSAGTGCVGPQCITTSPALAGAWIYQDIPTVPGRQYVVSFFYATSNPADTPIELQVFFGTVPASVNAPGTCTGSCIFDTQTGSNYVQITRTVTATSTSSRLEFLGRNDPAGIFVDDVSVTLAPGVPATSDWSLLVLALLIAGAAGVEFMRRRA